MAHYEHTTPPQLLATRPVSLASTMELMSPEINSLSSDVDDSPPPIVVRGGLHLHHHQSHQHQPSHAQSSTAAAASHLQTHGHLHMHMQHQQLLHHKQQHDDGKFGVTARVIDAPQRNPLRPTHLFG